MNTIEAHDYFSTLKGNKTFFGVARALKVLCEVFANDAVLEITLDGFKCVFRLTQGLETLMEYVIKACVVDNCNVNQLEMDIVDLEDTATDSNCKAEVFDFVPLSSYDGQSDMKGVIEDWIDSSPIPLYMHSSNSDGFSIITIKRKIVSMEYKCERTMEMAAGILMCNSFPSSEAVPDEDPSTTKMQNWVFISVWAGCGWEALERMI